MIPVVPCSPSEASRRAAWFRKYARAEGATAEQVAEREATAAAYQDMAVDRYVADQHDLSEARDE